MAEKKIRIKMNPGPGLTETFAHVDDEIQPVMIEVWDGKRIAWAIAILSALILIPALYLLYDSYWGKGRNTFLDQPRTETITERLSQRDVTPQPDSTSSSQTSRMNDNPKLTTTNSDAVSEHALSSPQLQIENESGAQIGQKMFETSKPSAQNQQTDSEIVVSEQLDSSPKVVTTAVISKPQTTPVTAPEQQLNLPDEIEITDTSSSESIEVIPTPTTGSPNPNHSLMSAHVTRALLVTKMSSREPVGESIDSIQIDKNNALRLYFFTELNGMAGQTIIYRWLHGEKLIYSKNVSVTGDNTWRSYIGKLIPHSMAGQWIVEVLDSHNNLLVKKSFLVH